MKNSKNSLKKNRRGDALPQTVLAIGILALCIFALISFNHSTKKTGESFKGLGLIEEMNSRIEENYFYEQQRQTTGKTRAERDLHTAILYAQEYEAIKRFCNCGEHCGEYEEYILQYSTENEIPDSRLFLSLMMQESECELWRNSGSSVGLMQINLDNCEEYEKYLFSSREDCETQLSENAELNIKIGAKILKEKYDTYKNGKEFLGCSNKKITYTGWEAALRGYNGWGCNPSLPAQDNFVEEIIQRYKMLKGELVQGDSFSAEYLGNP